MGTIEYFLLSLGWLGLLMILFYLPYFLKGFKKYVISNLYDTDDKKLSLEKYYSKLYLPFVIWVIIYMLFSVVLWVWSGKFNPTFNAFLIILLSVFANSILMLGIKFIAEKFDKSYKSFRKLSVSQQQQLKSTLEDETKDDNKKLYMKIYNIGFSLHLILIMVIYMTIVFANGTVIGTVLGITSFILWLLSFAYISFKVVDVFYVQEIKPFVDGLDKELR